MLHYYATLLFPINYVSDDPIPGILPCQRIEDMLRPRVIINGIDQRSTIFLKYEADDISQL